MKWNAGKETLNIGAVELENFMFNDDCIEVSIEIVGLSDDLQEEIEKAIEVKKAEHVKEWAEIYKQYPERKIHNHVWSDKPVKIVFTCLDVYLESGKVRYKISVGFVDAENENIEDDVSIEVDLSEHEAELKEAIKEAMIKKFF